MPTLKKTTICLSEDDRRKAHDLMERYNLSSMGQLFRFALERLAKSSVKDEAAR